MHARNMKHFSAAIFMDVEKACDKVWPAGLFLHFCAVKMTIQVESTIQIYIVDWTDVYDTQH